MNLLGIKYFKYDFKLGLQRKMYCVFFQIVLVLKSFWFEMLLIKWKGRY